MKTTGLFGPIEVKDRNGHRDLLINDQVQGGAYLSPPASILQGDLNGPGPIPTSKYMIGWLMAAADQVGSGLMVGLGSGAGAVALLYNNHDIDLTVVEIDPAIIEVATKAYPLLNFYQDMGRLRIVCADAGEYITKNTDDIWEFGCADGYTGDNRMEDHYLYDMVTQCETMYINMIDELGGKHIQQTSDLFESLGKPITEMMPVGYPNQPMYNIILTNALVDPQQRGNFVPFVDIDHFRADEWRLMWRQLVLDAG